MARFTQSGGSGSGTPGPQGPAGADGADGADALWNFIGEYDNGADYSPGDLVTYNGGTYYRVGEPNPGYPPGTEYWTTIAEPGADGADGSSTDTYSKIILTNNGTTDNIKIGDDVYLGDGNVANSVVIKGQQDATVAGVVLGSGKTETISTDGTNLSLDADNDIILNPGSSYAYLGAPTIGGETRIATRGYVDALGTTTSSYTPNWTGTGLAYTGTPAVGSYVKIGNLVTFHIQVTLTNVTNFGTGQYSITLPFAPIGDYAFRDGGIHAAGNHYTVMADAEAGSTTMDLWYIAGTGQDQPMDHNSPHTLTTTNKFYINGTYIAQ